MQKKLLPIANMRKVASMQIKNKLKELNPFFSLTLENNTRLHLTPTPQPTSN